MSQYIKYASDGSTIDLVSPNTTVYDDLPEGTYTFKSSMQRGLWLERVPAVPEVSCKVYGDVYDRVKKSMDAFDRRPGNTGILLSGEAGMGKSMFIKILCKQAAEKHLPIILVKDDFDGICDYLSRIETSCVVVLNEFEKNFPMGSDDDNHSQDKFLSLMDGMAAGKRLFVAAVNHTDQMNHFMFNRPARFLYHFRFTYLSMDEIGEFIEDRVENKANIPAIYGALVGHRVNFDALTAIVGELNAGYSIEETMRDLNLDQQTGNRYDLNIKVNGMEFGLDNWYIIIGSDGLVTGTLLEKTPHRYDFKEDDEDTDHKHILTLRFYPKDIKLKNTENKYVNDLVVEKKNLKMELYSPRQEDGGGKRCRCEQKKVKIIEAGDLILKEPYGSSGYSYGNQYNAMGWVDG